MGRGWGWRGKGEGGGCVSGGVCSGVYSSRSDYCRIECWRIHSADE